MTYIITHDATTSPRTNEKKTSNEKKGYFISLPQYPK